MTTVKVSRSLLRKVIAHFADSIHEFRQNETAPDGSIEIEAQEMIESEEKLLAELRKALAQPAEPQAGDVGRDDLEGDVMSELDQLIDRIHAGPCCKCNGGECAACDIAAAAREDAFNAIMRAIPSATTPPQEPVAWYLESRFPNLYQSSVSLTRSHAFGLYERKDCFKTPVPLYLAPPANDKAVRLLRLVKDEAFATDDYRLHSIPSDLIRTVSAFLTSHKQEGKDNGVR